MLPGVPYRLCQLHYPRGPLSPSTEADRHAKAGLKKKVRGGAGGSRQGRGAESIPRRTRCGRCGVPPPPTGDRRLEASGLKPRRPAGAPPRGPGPRDGQGGGPPERPRPEGILWDGQGSAGERSRFLVPGGFGWVRWAAYILQSGSILGGAAVRAQLRGCSGRCVGTVHPSVKGAALVGQSS